MTIDEMSVLDFKLKCCIMVKNYIFWQVEINFNKDYQSQIHIFAKVICFQHQLAYPTKFMIF